MTVQQFIAAQRTFSYFLSQMQVARYLWCEASERVPIDLTEMDRLLRVQAECLVGMFLIQAELLQDRPGLDSPLRVNLLG